MPVSLRATIEEFRYPGATAPALTGIGLTIQQGEFVLVVGPAGSGKTTLCYSLSGVIPKSVRGDFKGSVEVAGTDIAALPLPRLSPRLGLVLQSPENQLFNIRVAEDVAFGPENLLLPREEVRARVQQSLALTGTTHLEHRFSHLLSGGESQRVVLASVLALGAGILILDQPAAELDPRARRLIYENLAKLNRESGKTIVLVEDRTSDVIAHATRILLMDGGRIVHDLPPRAFFNVPDVSRYGVRLPDAVALCDRLVRGAPRDRPERGALCDRLETGVLSIDELPLSAGDAIARLKPLVPAGGASAGSDDHHDVHDEARQRSDSAPNPPQCDDPPALRDPARAAATPAIDARGLTYRYATGVEALKGVDLVVQPGEFVAIVGENGAGKTTLAKHLVGLLRPARGSIQVLGRDIGRLPVHVISRWLGFLFQDPDLQIFNNTCLDEVTYGLGLQGVPYDRAREEALQALARLDLAAFADAHPYTLSRGQRQRLAAASVLAIRPPILLVDEPTTGLDYRESVVMMGVLEEYRQGGGTVLIITHDMEMAAGFAARVVVMAGGRVIYDLPADRIQTHYDALAEAAIVLPDLGRIAHALGLPPLLRTVDQVAAAILARHRAASTERG
jgi:energy-coupling factor transport system ATP-binding protein